MQTCEISAQHFGNNVFQAQDNAEGKAPVDSHAGPKNPELQRHDSCSQTPRPLQTSLSTPTGQTVTENFKDVPHLSVVWTRCEGKRELRLAFSLDSHSLQLALTNSKIAETTPTLFVYEYMAHFTIIFPRKNYFGCLIEVLFDFATLTRSNGRP